MVVVSTKMSSIIEGSRITAFHDAFKKLYFVSQFAIPRSEIDSADTSTFGSGSQELMNIQLSNANLVVKTDFTG